MIRLDKFLVEMSIGSRSQIKEMARKGRITVNGKIIKNSDLKIDENGDKVAVDGNDVTYTRYEYFMLNKPAGVISATEDRHTKTVLDLIPDKSRKDLFPVGRLDKDTEGLLLITNDGDLAHKLLSPKKHVDKVYYAKIAGIVTEEHIKEFAKGLILSDGTAVMPAELRILSVNDSAENVFDKNVIFTEEDNISCVSEIELTIHEGKFHQVKRMFEAVGTKVIYLKRLSMGPLKLDNKLPTGNVRPLTDDEIKALYRSTDTLHNNVTEQYSYDTLLNNKTAVLFDLDGTLVDSMWIWRSIDIDYLSSIGEELPDNLQRDIEGMSFTETAVYFKNRFNIPDDLDTIMAKWNKMAYEKYTTEVPLKKGAYDFIKKLHEKGIKLGIASSNSRYLIESVTKVLGIWQYFDTIVTSCEAGAGKPAPDIYLLAAKNLGVQPENCLVFEDITMGIKAGKNAGMKVCAIEDAYSADTQAEKKALADYYINDYMDITF